MNQASERERRIRRPVGGEGDGGVAPATAYSVDSRRRRLAGAGAAPIARPAMDRACGGQPGEQRDRGDDHPLRDALRVPRTIDRRDHEQSAGGEDAPECPVPDQALVLRVSDPLEERDGQWDHRGHDQQPAQDHERQREGRQDRSDEERSGRCERQGSGHAAHALAGATAGQPPREKDQQDHTEGEDRHRHADAVEAIVIERDFADR